MLGKCSSLTLHPWPSYIFYVSWSHTKCHCQWKFSAPICSWVIGFISFYFASLVVTFKTSVSQQLVDFTFVPQVQLLSTQWVQYFRRHWQITWVSSICSAASKKLKPIAKWNKHYPRKIMMPILLIANSNWRCIVCQTLCPELSISYLNTIAALWGVCEKKGYFVHSYPARKWYTHDWTQALLSPKSLRHLQSYFFTFVFLSHFLGTEA
jgi:hypothetical protein